MFELALVTPPLETETDSETTSLDFTWADTTTHRKRVMREHATYWEVTKIKYQSSLQTFFQQDPSSPFIDAQGTLCTFPIPETKERVIDPTQDKAKRAETDNLGRSDNRRFIVTVH